MLLFLKILYDKILYILYYLCIEMMYSQYSSLCQPLKADTDGSCVVNRERVETFAQKMIWKAINFNWLPI